MVAVDTCLGFLLQKRLSRHTICGRACLSQDGHSLERGRKKVMAGKNSLNCSSGYLKMCLTWPRILLDDRYIRINVIGKFRHFQIVRG